MAEHSQSHDRTERNKERARRYIDELWNKKNASVIDEIISADYIMRHPDGTLRGSEEFKRNYSSYIRAFPDFQVAIEGDMVAAGDEVAFAFQMTGTHMGELMGIAPTGRRVATKGMIIFRFGRDGKAVEERSIWDTLPLMRGIGKVIDS